MAEIKQCLRTENKFHLPFSISCAELRSGGRVPLVGLSKALLTPRQLLLCFHGIAYYPICSDLTSNVYSRVFWNFLIIYCFAALRFSKFLQLVQQYTIVMYSLSSMEGIRYKFVASVSHSETRKIINICPVNCFKQCLGEQSIWNSYNILSDTF